MDSKDENTRDKVDEQDINGTIPDQLSTNATSSSNLFEIMDSKDENTRDKVDEQDINGTIPDQLSTNATSSSNLFEIMDSKDENTRDKVDEQDINGTIPDQLSTNATNSSNLFKIMDSKDENTRDKVDEQDINDTIPDQLSSNATKKRHRIRPNKKAKGLKLEHLSVNLKTADTDDGSNSLNESDCPQNITNTQDNNSGNVQNEQLSKNSRKKVKYRNPEQQGGSTNSVMPTNNIASNLEQRTASLSIPGNISSPSYKDNIAHLQQRFGNFSVGQSPNNKKHQNHHKSVGRNIFVSPKQTATDVEQDTIFPNYWSESMIKLGIENKSIFQGVLRINKKNYQEAYITHPDGDQDVIIEKLINRNRALEGDTVLVKINNEENWTAEGQRTGFVVSILIKGHPRTCIGTFKLQNIREDCTYLLFIPRDCRMPRMRIASTDWPDILHNNRSKEVEDILYLGSIKDWFNTKYAVGTILKSIGKAGSIEVETHAILLENDLDGTPHGPEMDKFFPQTPFVIPHEEYSYRRDCRNMCIFTIDPETAKDLDDAVSCVELENGNFEIGVHISDVGYFLKPENDLDEAVAKKATTIYMVDTVYHMLPTPLCMMCSLLPGNDKLAFSVFWEMTKEAKIVDHKITRTIINSCSQLAYEHAQMMIENPTKNFNNDAEMPVVYNNYKPNDLCKIVNQLNRIALILKQNRFENGALKIDNPKLSFKLNRSTHFPESYSFENSVDSHKLIEEYMLLANVTIAKHLYNCYPKLAFLRMHPSPVLHLMKELKSFLSKFGINLNINSAKEIQQSLTELAKSGLNGRAESMMTVMNNMCSRVMARARYFCAEEATCENDFWHYALHVPLYTHFTSPIRRYADIMVHRQLAESLGYQTALRSPKESHEVAAQCNKNKYNAKKAFEMSSDLFLRHYIAQNSPIVERGIVCDVKDRSLDILILSMALTRRIYYKTLPDTTTYKIITDPSNKKIMTLEIEWSYTPIYDKQKSLNKEENDTATMLKIDKLTDKTTVNIHDNLKIKQTVKIFTEVFVKLTGKPDASSIEAFLLHPSHGQ